MTTEDPFNMNRNRVVRKYGLGFVAMFKALSAVFLIVATGCAGAQVSGGQRKSAPDDLAFIAEMLDAMKSLPGHRGVIIMNRKRLPNGRIQFGNGTVIDKRLGWDPFGIVYDVRGNHCIRLKDVALLAESRGFPAETQLGERPDSPMLDQRVDYVLRDGESVKRFVVQISPSNHCMTQFGIQGSTKGFTNRFDEDGNWER